jgi:hypothetical protein
MFDFDIARLEKGVWHPELIDELERLIAPSYGPGAMVLADELLRSDRLYLARDAQGLAAFMLVARVRLPVGVESRQARYVGLSAVRQDQRGSGGALAALHARFSADVRSEEARLGCRLLVFSTTDTPLGLRRARALWGEVQPADTSFPVDLGLVARAAARWLGAATSRQHPCVLPGLGTLRRHGAGNREWIETEADRREVDLIRQLGVDEANGDRLLLFCSLPGVKPETEAEAA